MRPTTVRPPSAIATTTTSAADPGLQWAWGCREGEGELHTLLRSGTAFHDMEQETAIDKALGLLFFLHERAPCGVSEIGRALGLPKSSAHRLLGALGRRGLVERDEQGRYRTGFALLALGLGALEREPLATAARP